VEPKQNQRSRSRRLVMSLVLVLVSVLFVAFLFETGLRVTARFFYPKMMVLDDKLGWRHATNVNRTFVNEFGEKAPVVLNSFGFRGSPRTINKSPDRRRILVLGDSFTEGVQVGEQELFTARIEMADPKLEVINTGVGGYGTVQEYLYLASEGLRFNPDFVLLMFFENDLSDSALSYSPGFGPRPFARLEEDGLHIVEVLDSSEHRKYIMPVPFRSALNRYSYFYYFLNAQVYQPLLSKQMRAMQQADLNRIDSETRYKIFDGVVSKLARLLDQQRIRFLVVLIPNRDDAMRGHSEAVKVVSNLCAARNIEHLSLLDRFHADSSSGSSLYFPEDIHWTKDGHRVAAEEILGYLHSDQ
jgi:lysophospholipase L1-like esterase